ncbi:CocE/NonD family hydrolase [Actinoplanes auranticolor]|uniref:X-Pro dipeptidyl-peptidase n=1 Tax=Actinoplanes auranticolor TaxID=47988 RepID=A0A919VJT1_9ACTN|nr:CocE/NonD family hydrolase [Actinoplanes auranticolor]GIM65744.1 X-Pro dipeptidyl-peptidase [Actinoplanes auranticolor]
MSLSIDTGVAVPMRDGVALATDLWRPGGTGPWPVLLARTPYGRTSTAHLGNPKLPDIRVLVENGYLVVVQDVRGTADSPGLLEPHRFDGSDTVDTLAWIAGQPWCDGTVGMWGASYMGFAQWQAAAQAPPVLRAIAPLMTTADPYAAWHSAQGAVAQSTLLNWSARMALANLARPESTGPSDAQDAAEIRAALDDVDKLISGHSAIVRGLPWLGEMLAHPDYDVYWRQLSALDRSAAITVPAFNLTGWYDVFAREVVRSYTTMRRSGGSSAAREGQRLVIGPWGHGDGADLGVFPDRSFGLAGSVKAAAVTSAHLRFFDRYVKGHDDVDTGARVRIFVMGLDQWRDEDDWPLPDTRYEDHFLHSAGRANGSQGDGRLHPAPAADEFSDSFSYDPLRPVPTVGGATLGAGGLAGPADQADVERRDDVLCYTSESLETPLEVTGHVALTVHVSSTAVDTDVTGKLVDVFPDGRAIILCEGSCRMRYRSSLSRPQPLVPGEIAEATVELGVTSNVFLPGHRIRLEVSSSDFPRYDRNLTTGVEVAVNRIFHGPEHPSRLTLPVIARNP